MLKTRHALRLRTNQPLSTVKTYLFCSIDLDLMTFIIDHDLEQMTLAKCKKDQTCSDWRDIENLSFCYFDLDLWPWYSTLTYFHTHNKVSRSIGYQLETDFLLFFYCYDLDIWPITLILKRPRYCDDLLLYQNVVNRSIGSKVIYWKQRHTDRHTRVKPLPTRSRGR